MPFILHNNCKIEYEIDGAGKGLVLLHGTAQNAQSNWGFVYTKFTNNRTVVRPNYSGSGKTEDDNRRLSIPFLAEQIIAVTENIGMDRFDLVGHSLGTCIAMYIAAEYPEKVNKLVLLAGFVDSKDSRMQLQFKMWHELAETNPRFLAELFVFSAFSPEFVAKLGENKINEFVEMIYSSTNWQGALRQIELDLNVDVMKYANKIKQQTLIIACSHDYITPAYHSEKLLGIIKNSSYKQIEAGHGATFEQPEKFADILSEFFEI